MTALPLSKHILIAGFAGLILLVPACSKGADTDEPVIIEMSELIEKDAVTYTLASDTAFTGKAVETYENGALKSESFYEEGRRNGLRRDYHENGALSFTVTYIKGNYDGQLETYYENGQLNGRETYANGVLLTVETYYKNGQLKEKGQYNEAGETGEWEYHFENDTGKMVLIYRDGVLESATCYDASGQVDNSLPDCSAY